MLGLALVGVVGLFFLVAIAIVIWASAVAGRKQDLSRVAESRHAMIALASRAASDESGRGLLDLLSALDHAPPDCPVQASWLVHRPARGAEGMLVRISWDGNEWRRIYPYDTLYGLLEGQAGPEGRARQLVTELEALRGR